jgi:hypothetical protein
MGQVFCSKSGKLNLDFPYLSHYSYSIWKINVKKILFENCFIRFKNVRLTFKISYLF